MSLLPIALATVFWLPISAQTLATSPDPFQALRFLEGTWNANVVQDNGAVKRKRAR